MGGAAGYDAQLRLTGLTLHSAPPSSSPRLGYPERMSEPLPRPLLPAALPETFDMIVYPVSRLSGTIAAQPSKNYTTRYLLAAALSEGRTRVVGVATSEDAGAMLRCLADWGAGIEHVGDDVVVTGFGARPKSGVTLNPGNAGAVARFLMAVAALTGETRFVTDHPESLGKRPQADLLATLKRLGARAPAAWAACFPSRYREALCAEGRWR